MSGLIYFLCSCAALGCAVLLLRAHRRTGTRLLLWSGLCFVGLTINNLLVVIDLVIFPDVDFFLFRNLAALVGLSLLVYGLIWDSR